MLNSINRFRAQNGIGPVEYGDNLVNHYCQLHCYEMARRGDAVHAPDHYLNGWSEAVAIMPYNEHWKDIVIFDLLGTSEGHRDILLHSNKISYAGHINNWVVYVTIRGTN